MKEDFLQFAWKFRLFASPDLETTDGEGITILKPGIHNTNAGPDFLEASLKIGGQVWNGHVEIHVKASDWNNHQHSNDPAYNNVILHAVFDPDLVIDLGKNGDLPVLDLSRFIDMSYQNNYASLMQGLSDVACANHLPKVKDITKKAWLERLSFERLERKTNEIYALVKLNQGDWRETFYQLLARNFGFKINAHGMSFLTENLPLNVIEHHMESRFQLEALFFGQSGLLNKNLADPLASELWAEYEYLSKKFRISSLNVAVWKRLRLMPANFPEIRISQFAHFLHLHQDFFSVLIEVGSKKQAIDAFSVEASEYWKSHSAFDKGCKPRKVKLGRASIENILINSVAPILFAYGKHKVKQQLVDIALQIMEEVKAENNKIVRSWIANGLPVNSARESQASIELYNEYCTHKKCLNCMIGAELISSQ